MIQISMTVLTDIYTGTALSLIKVRIRAGVGDKIPKTYWSGRNDFAYSANELVKMLLIYKECGYQN